MSPACIVDEGYPGILCAPFGEVEGVRIFSEPKNGKSLGCARACPSRTSAAMVAFGRLAGWEGQARGRLCQASDHNASDRVAHVRYADATVARAAKDALHGK